MNYPARLWSGLLLSLCGAPLGAQGRPQTVVELAAAREKYCAERIVFSQIGSANRPPVGGYGRGGIITVISGEPVCVYSGSRMESTPILVAPAELYPIWQVGKPEAQFIGLAEPDCPLTFAASGNQRLALLPPQRIKRDPADDGSVETICRPSVPAWHQLAEARVEPDDVTVVTWHTEAASTKRFPISTWLNSTRPDAIVLRNFIELPAGEFWISCNAVSGGCAGGDRGYPVRLTHGFSIAAQETSTAEYLLGQLSYSTALPSIRPELPRSDTGEQTQLVPIWRPLGYPAVNISHDEAEQFCRMMGGRLPTEVEWEYAARLDGGALLRDTAPTPRRDAAADARDTRPRQAARGSKAIQPIADPGRRSAPVNMRGNASEWLADRYDDAVYNEHRDVPKPPTVGNRFVIGGGVGAGKSGGSWARQFLDGSPDPGVGFRCAKD